MNGREAQARDIVLAALASVAPEADLSTLAPAASLRRELDLDSIDFQNLVIRLGKDARIDIPDRDAPRLATLAACVEYLAARM